MQDSTRAINTNDPKQAEGLAMLERLIGLMPFIPLRAMEKAVLAMMDTLAAEVPEQAEAIAAIRRDLTARQSS